MTRNRFTQIGIDRILLLTWLEKTAFLSLAGNEAGDIKKILQDDLQASFRSGRTDVRGSLDKTITILMRVWPVSYTHLRAHETVLDLVCRLLLEKKNNKKDIFTTIMQL